MTSNSFFFLNCRMWPDLTNESAGLWTYSCSALQPQAGPGVIFLHAELEVGGGRVEAGLEARVLGEPVLGGRLTTSSSETIVGGLDWASYICYA